MRTQLPHAILMKGSGILPGDADGSCEGPYLNSK